MPVHDVLRQRVQPLTAAVTSNRIFLYSVFSSFAVAATIANACRAHSTFYSVSIYLAKSSRSVLVRTPFHPLLPFSSCPLKVLANFGFICALLFGRLLQNLFFGSLQPREVEVCSSTLSFLVSSFIASTASLRPDMDVRHRVPPRLHHLP